jgi:hypothetical protein
VVLSPNGAGKPMDVTRHTSGEEALVTTANQYRPTSTHEISDRRSRSDQDEWRKRSTVSPAALARVFAHLRALAPYHPDSPATGLYWMSGAEWRACIAELRRRGYLITESIVTKSDCTADEIGYSLCRRAIATRTAPVPRASTSSAASGAWLVRRPFVRPGEIATTITL